MILEPLSQFVLARGLEDHTDSSTYYVRAVVRDAKTDALIDTVNLTNNGSRRFTKLWQVPPDPTGEGRDILITFTVYTDSGYTTKADNYGERFDEHRVWHQMIHGGGGGSDINYKKIQKMITDAISGIQPQEQQKPDFSPLSDSLQAILTEIREIDIPKPEKVTFTPLMARFDALEQSIKKAVQDKEVTPQPDLEPILAAMSALRADFQPDVENFQAKLDQLFSRIQEFFKTDVETVKSEVSSVNDKLDNVAYMVLTSPPKQEQKTEPINYNQLLK